MRDFSQVHLVLACCMLATASRQESDGWMGKTGPNTQHACKQKPDYHWNGESGLCLPCTKCHPLGLVTLLGCSPTKDALCGTMQDFKKQMEEQILRRGRSDERKGSWQPYRVALSDEARYPDNESDDNENDDQVFGKTVKFSDDKGDNSKTKWSKNRNDGATHQIRQRVKNQSQHKNEFLRQLQEEENISRDSDPSVGDDDIGSSPFDDLEGQVKFSVDQSVSAEKWVRSGNLHEDLRLIEKELLNGGFKREGGGEKPFTSKEVKSDKEADSIPSATSSAAISTSTTTTTTEVTSTTVTTTNAFTRSTTLYKARKVASTRTTTITTSTTIPTTTTTRFSSTTIPDWLKEDYNILDEEENLVGKNEHLVAEGDDQTGVKRFIPSTSFDNFGTEDDKDDEIFGAVVKNPSYEEEDSGKVPDEFGLLSRILYKNDGRGSQHKGQATTLEGESTGLDLTHSLVIIGFVIGFSIVFAVGLLYTKVFRMKRFKLLDNRASAASSVGDTSLLASRTSSFLRNGSDNRTATSPLLHGQQSPQLTSRTIVATSLETDPPLLITEPSLTPLTGVSPSGSGASSPGNYSNSVHASYVDRLGRTVLKPVRELPV